MIKLPKLLEEKLKQSPDLMSGVMKTFEAFEPWLEQSGMPFFPGFTDHSPRHINEVLSTASSLISDKSHELLSSADVAVLAIAVLLHDCGMHLTQDGFRALIAQQTPTLISGLQDKPWNQLWNDFLAEATRFSDERLLNIFGDTEPLNISNLDIKNLSERDCLLCGEFVRRHHARLAHEIAIDQVPMTNGNGLKIIGVDKDFCDLAGLIARSHGMSIRSTFLYLDSNYRIPEFREVKIPYLMAVLRISDYIQVQSDRAIRSLLSVKELRSPLSRQEWRNHFSVRDVSTRDIDPEAVFVHAAPADVKTYLRLTNLFKDIQRELDDSWATLGEVYGRLGELSQLGINIRRVKSNLDDSRRFATTVPYIPSKANFSTSGPDLLKLLVGPLYDYDYSIGIRELLQNAVDACKERSDLTKEEDQKVTVEIDVEEGGTGWITITDTGVGMSLETITKYFLVAGASFRNSDAWKRQHTDSHGQIKILRGGRFGVGALAAFLLGEEIHVKTRHMDSDETDGLEFSAKLDDPTIELRKTKTPSGTSIRIWVNNPKVMKHLSPHIHILNEEINQGEIIELSSWNKVDWYAQANPKVIFNWSGFVDVNYTFNNPRKIKVKATYQAKSGLIPLKANKDWNELPNPQPYNRIIWQYPPTKKINDHLIKQPRETIVNGIRIKNNDPYNSRSYLIIPNQEKFEDPGFLVFRPSIAISDPAGICPINLQRSQIAFDRMNVDEKIANEIIKNFIIDIVGSAPKKLTINSYKSYIKTITQDERLGFNSKIIPPIFSTKYGISLVTPRFLEELKIKKVFFVAAENTPKDLSISKMLEEGQALIISPTIFNEQAELTWFRSIFGSREYYWRSSQHGFPLVSHKNEAGFLSKNIWETINTKGRVSQNILKKIDHQSFSDGSVFACASDTEDIQKEVNYNLLDDLSNKISIENGLYIWDIEHINLHRLEKSPFCEFWTETIGSPLLAI